MFAKACGVLSIFRIGAQACAIGGFLAWLPPPQGGPKSIKISILSPSWFILALLAALLAHLGALEPHLIAKLLQDGANMPQFSPFLTRSRPRSKKGRQDVPKSAPSWPSWLPSWPSWTHLGAKLANLAPSWRILAPRCVPTGIQMEPQMRAKVHLGPSWRQECRPGPQKWSRSLNFS